MKEEEILIKTIDIIQMVDVIKEADKIVFTDEAIDAINEFAEEVMKTNIYKKTIGKDLGWLKQATPEKIFKHMCLKIITAPTHIHKIMMPVVLIPLLAEALKREEKE